MNICIFLLLFFLGFDSFSHIVPEKGKKHQYLISIYPYLSPLSKAIADENMEKALTLIQQGTDVHAKDIKGHTAIHVVSLTGNMRIAKLLLKKGVDINVKDKDKHTSLHGTALVGHMKLASLFIQRGAEINARDIMGYTPLHQASWNGHTEIVSLLLKNGANINVQDEKGYTPLHRAVSEGYMETTSLLLKSGAKNIKNRDGQLPVDLAEAIEMKELIKSKTKRSFIKVILDLFKKLIAVRKY